MRLAYETTAALADEFDLPPIEFVEALGGGWREVEPSTSPTGTANARWFATGDPLLALLGISATYVFVGRPRAYGGGLAGPPTLEVASMSQIDRDGDFLFATGQAIARAIAAELAHWRICHGCRAYLPVTDMSGAGHPYCSGCQQRYLGIIAC